MAKKKVNEMTDKNVAIGIIMNQAKIEPDMFNVWRGGPYWESNIEFKYFIDAIMHLLLLGVTKSSKNLLEVVLKKIVKRTIENKQRDVVYKTISIWGLDWLKLIMSSTGWVSDNYLAFFRIMKWFYFEELETYNMKTNDSDTKCIFSF